MLKQISYTKFNVAKSPLNLLSRNSGFEHSSEEKLNWKKFNTEITDIRLAKLNVKH
jgi:hypothetical protein